MTTKELVKYLLSDTIVICWNFTSISSFDYHSIFCSWTWYLVNLIVSLWQIYSQIHKKKLISTACFVLLYNFVHVTTKYTYITWFSVGTVSNAMWSEIFLLTLNTPFFFVRLPHVSMKHLKHVTVYFKLIQFDSIRLTFW